ncbi:MAG: hypothetical protein A2087_13945 [Spirochaetes bacterium GWD1_61_31]|nr:MAG: hypothetical protein A2Y37_04840 [Spirochaetes bacterium GWB1_60_80]OHD29127.1 MAG: hypothetical protein A2004_10675 [Spirochaetes bacterium GWC1_61_12]OHD41885.1 MAG: hypothetical protein A2087_13945 [Spirochaetes bacterium GWD1_61_31]OHD43706.1 MAG: hypothetical protein A2Y35_00035 [Spirochaetes bacterium GWE1_60_18]OHD60187.1 MAG: hypothetical protein A2Y32_07080 [Spirochaetes bacterium GWF1_60_12]HAP42534.1 hypothetical protein [Spirochaetaceae bacterium]
MVLGLCLLFAWPASLVAEEFSSERGFFIDLPEGYQLLAEGGANQFVFIGPDQTARLEIKIFDPGRYASFSAFAEAIKAQLDSRMQYQSYDYAGRGARLANFTRGSGAAGVSGHLFLFNQTAAESPFFLVIMSYTVASRFDADDDFLRSALDGFSADGTHRGQPGPISAAALASLPPGGLQPQRIRFGEAVIDLAWDPRLAAVAQDLVEREFRVLLPYAEVPELLESAMRRFYRLVYRQTARGLDELGLHLSAAWESGAWKGEAWTGVEAPVDQASPAAGAAATRQPPAGQPTTVPAGAGSVSQASGQPRYGIPAASRAYVAALLAWTQSFVYERDPAGSDVVNPLTAAFEQRGDCDSRALVLAILLRQESVDAGVMISLVHSHALAMFDVPGLGARFPYVERQWLVGETTAAVTPGQIAQSQSDIADWFGITFDY